MCLRRQSTPQTAWPRRPRSAKAQTGRALSSRQRFRSDRDLANFDCVRRDRSRWRRSATRSRRPSRSTRSSNSHTTVRRRSKRTARYARKNEKKQPAPAAEFALVPSRQCLEKKKDWRQCGAAREAMDKCVEEGEQQRFFIDSQCSRWKRQYQSCLLESKTMPAPFFDAA